MKIGLTAIVKNESPYLLEWIAYHRRLGVDYFFVYDNLSTDTTYEMLRALQKTGFVKCYRQLDVPAGSPQLEAYNHSIRLHGSDVDLMIFIDADEFIVSVPGVDPKRHLEQIFEADPELGAIGLRWLIFGSGGRVESGDGLVIERFTSRNRTFSSTVKSVVRPKAVEKMLIHCALLREGYYGNEEGRRVELHKTAEGVPYGIDVPDYIPLWVNHYMTKSHQEFLAKRARGNANYAKDHPEKFKRFTDEYFRSHDKNDVEDSRALRDLDGVKAEMALLHGFID